ncbi:unnamed protein product, partial [Prorocentrum cordatum]
PSPWSEAGKPAFRLQRSCVRNPNLKSPASALARLPQSPRRSRSRWLRPVFISGTFTFIHVSAHACRGTLVLMTEAAKLTSSKHCDYDSLLGPAGDSLEVSKKSAGVTTKGNSVLVTAGVIIGDTLGAGLLTMPGAVSMFGWFVGSLFIVGLLALNLHMCMLLWRMRMAFPHAHTLGELAEASFSRAPKWQQTLMRQFTDNVQYVYVFFMLSADSTSLGKGFGLLFYDVHLCLPVWVLIGRRGSVNHTPPLGARRRGSPSLWSEGRAAFRQERAAGLPTARVSLVLFLM